MTFQTPEDTNEDLRLAAGRGRLLESVAHERTPRYSRARKAASVVGISVLAAALTGGTIAVVQASQDEVTYSVQCYEAASLDADFATVGSPTATDRKTGEARRDPTDPVSTCGDLWRMGLVGQEAAPADPNAADFPVPAIIGCTLSNGVGAGFPRGSSTSSDRNFCRDLGLAVWIG